MVGFGVEVRKERGNGEEILRFGYMRSERYFSADYIFLTMNTNQSLPY
jgi:hypothetical protein